MVDVYDELTEPMGIWFIKALSVDEVPQPILVNSSRDEGRNEVT